MIYPRHGQIHRAIWGRQDRSVPKMGFRRASKTIPYDLSLVWTNPQGIWRDTKNNNNTGFAGTGRLEKLKSSNDDITTTNTQGWELRRPTTLCCGNKLL